MGRQTSKHLIEYLISYADAILLTINQNEYFCSIIMFAATTMFPISIKIYKKSYKIIGS